MNLVNYVIMYDVIVSRCSMGMFFPEKNFLSPRSPRLDKNAGSDPGAFPETFSKSDFNDFGA